MALSGESLVLFLTLFVALLIFYSFVQRRIKIRERYGEFSYVDLLYTAYGLDVISHQNDDIFNISSRVTQNQDHPWPPHDAHISIDHFNIIDHLNKPMYDDAPPSYDEVMKTLEQAQSGGEGSTPIQVVVEAPKTTATPAVATPRLS